VELRVATNTVGAGLRQTRDSPQRQWKMQIRELQRARPGLCRRAFRPLNTNVAFGTAPLRGGQVYRGSAGKSRARHGESRASLAIFSSACRLVPQSRSVHMTHVSFAHSVGSGATSRSASSMRSRTPRACGTAQPPVRPVRRHAAEQATQLALGILEHLAPLGTEAPAAAVDVKVEHRHGRCEWSRAATATLERRASQRGRDSAPRTLLEHAWLEIECVAAGHDPSRPAARSAFASRGAGRSG
jgi:hypothetical protein